MKNVTVRLNLLAKDRNNALDIVEATEGQVYIGIMVKNFSSIDEAVEQILDFQQANIPVSVGLGAGDPTQWKRVVEAAIRTKPVHVNQVFPAAGYTLAALKGVGSDHTIVNALISPAGSPGKVSVCTGPESRNFQDAIFCDAAAAMLQEIGVHSVKFYPIEGQSRLDEVAEMVRASVRQGITIFEPTGGIDIHSVHKVVEVCAENGAKIIIPHIYTALVDKTTGLTDPKEAAKLLTSLSGC
jgi:2-dehydro-3-deoxy-phosphogluconate aldolase